LPIHSKSGLYIVLNQQSQYILRDIILLTHFNSILIS
jgi:hypothetical protein